MIVKLYIFPTYKRVKNTNLVKCEPVMKNILLITIIYLTLTADCHLVLEVSVCVSFVKSHYTVFFSIFDSGSGSRCNMSNIEWFKVKVNNKELRWFSKLADLKALLNH